jgi:delta 1-pyrroline-5-carboxylate dehydrogenase
MLSPMPIPPEERVRQLCALLSVAEGEELENAIAELRSAVRILLHDVQNVSTYNLMNFPAALDKRKKA